MPYSFTGMEREAAPHGRDRVEELLLSLFSASELRRVVSDLPVDGSLHDDLPVYASPHRYVHALVDALAGRDALDDRFFDLLLRERPGRGDDIEACRAAIVHGVPAPAPSATEALEGALTSLPSRLYDQLEWQEGQQAVAEPWVPRPVRAKRLVEHVERSGTRQSLVDRMKRVAPRATRTLEVDDARVEALVVTDHPRLRESLGALEPPPDDDDPVWRARLAGAPVGVVHHDSDAPWVTFRLLDALGRHQPRMVVVVRRARGVRRVRPGQVVVASALVDGDGWIRHPPHGFVSRATDAGVHGLVAGTVQISSADDPRVPQVSTRVRALLTDRGGMFRELMERQVDVAVVCPIVGESRGPSEAYDRAAQVVRALVG